MTLWKPILLILPAGLVVGLIGAQLAAPRGTIVSERAALYAAESERRFDARKRASPYYSQESEAGENSRPGGYRPDLDWEEEFWSGSRGEAYAYYDDYPIDDWTSGTANDRAFEDAFSAPSGGLRNRSAAEEAGLAAERAAEEALQAAQGSPQTPAAAPAPPLAPAAPAEREPRTADGDLPAIW